MDNEIISNENILVTLFFPSGLIQQITFRYKDFHKYFCGSIIQRDKVFFVQLLFNAVLNLFLGFRNDVGSAIRASLLHFYNAVSDDHFSIARIVFYQSIRNLFNKYEAEK